MDNPRARAINLAGISGASAYLAAPEGDEVDAYREQFETVLAASEAFEDVPMTELSDLALDHAHAYDRWRREFVREFRTAGGWR